MGFSVCSWGRWGLWTSCGKGSADSAKIGYTVESMSSLATHSLPAPSPEPVFRLSVEQYHTMIDAGVLTDDDPVELLEGILVFKMPKKPKHSLVVRLLTSAIDRALPTNFHFQAQEPITLMDGEPEPDGVIVRGQPRDYAERHPGPADVALVI